MKFYFRVLITRSFGGIYHFLLHMEEESRGKYLSNLYFENLVLIKSLIWQLLNPLLRSWIAGHFGLRSLERLPVWNARFQNLDSCNTSIYLNFSIDLYAYIWESNYKHFCFLQVWLFCSIYENVQGCHNSLDWEIPKWKSSSAFCCDSVSLRGRLRAISGVWVMNLYP